MMRKKRQSPDPRDRPDSPTVSTQPKDDGPAHRIQALPGWTEDGEALFLLVTHSGGVYFVNNSSATQIKVASGAGGFATVSDDDVATMQEADRAYQDVRPGDAVLIGYHDNFYDLDFVWTYNVTVHSPTLGVLTFKVLVGKGKTPRAVFMWRDLPPMKKEADGQLVSPGRAAEEYKTRTGHFLPRDVFLNQGDLRMPYAEARVAASGLVLKRESHRGGNVTVYDFIDERETLVFRAYSTQDVADFLEAPRGQ